MMKMLLLVSSSSTSERQTLRCLYIRGRTLLGRRPFLDTNGPPTHRPPSITRAELAGRTADLEFTAVSA